MALNSTILIQGRTTIAPNTPSTLTLKLTKEGRKYFKGKKSVRLDLVAQFKPTANKKKTFSKTKLVKVKSK